MDVSAVSSTDVWAVGDAYGRPLVMHWDGKSWTTTASSATGTSLSGVAARASTTCGRWDLTTIKSLQQVVSSIGTATPGPQRRPRVLASMRECAQRSLRCLSERGVGGGILLALSTGRNNRSSCATSPERGIAAERHYFSSGARRSASVMVGSQPWPWSSMCHQAERTACA